ncbi:MBL fold metallo-hydrolase [Paenibacillus sp.]|uniref:MBL fold metallo-hydrolase n=1 Tax=Paenibacillus sp. TaxID=58172 RepID=UPI002812509A|nr:MBL fold metallo-hydrolase [Paenibacillus sp.]
MKISDRIYLVGSGKFGMELSEPTDCNVYLIDGGTECALIDAGGGIEPERIVDNLRRDGIGPERIRYCLLTHAHADHAAGARYFHDTYGIEIIASAETGEWLERGDTVKASVDHAKRGGVYPQDYRYPACPVARTLADGDRIRIGDVELRTIDSPGHARGHVCFLWEEGGRRNLFAGDTVFAGGKVVVQYVWDCILEEYADTLAKLHRLGANRLFAGHGPFLLDRADVHIEKAHRCFERLEIPPNL